MISGNHFPPNPRVWQQRKMKFSGKSFPVDQHLLLWPGNDFTLSFSLQIISGKREREREREEKAQIGERERKKRLRWRSHRSSIAIVDRAACRTIAPISPPISPSPRDFIFSSAARSQFDRIWWIFLLGFVSFVNECGIDSLCASLQLRKCMENWVCKAFSVKMFEWTKHQNWFSVKRILWQTNTWKHFLFWKIAFSENRIFSENAFTQTKHTLNESHKE